MYLIGRCVLQASMHLVIPPRNGHLVYLNGTTVEEQQPKFLVGAVINGTIVQYRHSRKGSFHDQMVWEVSCLDGPLLNISLSAVIAPIDSTPPTATKRMFDVTLYQNEHFSLSDVVFQIEDMDSPVEETLFVVINDIAGALVKSENPFETNRLFPSGKVSSDSIKYITQFHLFELRQRLVWYIPLTEGNNNTDTIEFTLVDSNGNRADEPCSLRISKSPLKLQETLFISTDQPYPPVLSQKSTITIFDIYGVYITSLYVYTSVPSVTPADIVYTVTTPIKNGHLCIISVKDCNSSISEFTQQDINRQRIFYLPSQEFEQETIVLIPTIYKIPSFIPRRLSLSIELARNQLPVVKKVKPFWVNHDGTEKKIPARFFRRFSRAAKFKVTKRTEYGRLSYRNGSNNDLEYFDRKDLIEARVWYEYDRTIPFVCSDHFTFDIILGNTRYSSDFQILIRQSSKSKLNVNISSHQLLGQNRFVIGSNDFDISSSFCPEFVKFYLIEPPKFGVLSLTDVKKNLVIQLKAFSTFTAKDIKSGLLHYSLRHVGPVTSNMTDNLLLNASDPVSQWPSQLTRNTPPGVYIVRIELQPNISHFLQIVISSSKAVTWLEHLGKYGYVLNQRDVRILNSTLQPSDVIIQVENYEPYGALSSSSFSVEQVHSGEVWYELNNIPPDGPYTTTFNITMYIYLRTPFLDYFSRHDKYHTFTLSWAVVKFDKRRVVVSEEDGRVIITIRRKGPLWFESKMMLTTFSGSASLANCSNPKHLNLNLDFCQVTHEIVFKVNMSVYHKEILIIDDDIPERNETFIVELSKPVNATLHPRRSTASMEVVIIDHSDYASVRMVNLNCLIPRCMFTVRTVERVGTLPISLLRTGNLDGTVGVFCKTRSNNNHVQEGLDFEGRNSMVWFGPNQTSAVCNVTIIDDTVYESSERFFVYIEENTDVGMAKTEEGASEMSIVIDADSTDEPSVSFSKSEMVVQENETDSVYVPFTLIRSGPDLHNTSVVQYKSAMKAGSTATPDVDFIINQGDINDDCSRGPGSGCVEFPPGLRLKTAYIEIYPDLLLEGNETFYLEIVIPVRFAHAGFQSQLKVTILDASELAIIGFETTQLTVSELITLNSINITRKGNTRVRSTVLCKFKGASATVGILGMSSVGADLKVPPKPVKVSFEAGVKEAKCSFFVEDDDVYEIAENFNLILEINDVGVELSANMSKAVVTIVDLEDIPTIQFGVASLSVMEPLTNYELDLTTIELTLVRSGDTSRPTAIQYSVNDHTAIGGLDFDNKTKKGIVTFLIKERVKTLSVMIMEDHANNMDTDFSVNLSVIGTGNIEWPDEVAIGTNGSVTVYITNRDVVGPIIPALPLVVNIGVPDPLISNGFYDSPLECIMPCAAASPTSEMYQTFCDRQNISTEDSVYSWEYSLDGEYFKLINTSSAISNDHSQFLEQIYLKQGIYVRCTCLPVNYAKVKGHPRTSKPMYLNKTLHNCNIGQEALKVYEQRVTLASYDTFSRQHEDLVELSISVPHEASSVPILSTQPLTNEQLNSLMADSDDQDTTSISSITDKHFCSNLKKSVSTLWNSLSNGVERSSLYSQLNYETCEWTFTKWYPLAQLIEGCGAVLDANHSVSLTVYTHYVRFMTEQRLLVVSNRSTNATLQANYSDSSFLPPPVYTLELDSSSTNRGDSYVYPIAAQDSVKIYFYSIGDFDSGQFYLTGSEPEKRLLVLLHTNKVQRRQAWLLEAVENTPGFKYNITLQGCLECNNREPSHFCLKLQRRSELNSAAYIAPYLDVVLSAQHQDVSELEKSNATYSLSTFKVGDIVNVSLMLSGHQKIQSGFLLLVTQVYLCNEADPDNCSVVIGIGNDGANRLYNIHFDHHLGLDGISFSFETSSILLVSSTSHWNLFVTYALGDTKGFHHLTQTIDLSLTILRPSQYSNTPTNPTEVAPADQRYLHASIVVFIIAVVIVAITFLVVGLMVWLWKVKNGLKAKVDRVIASQRLNPMNSMHLNHRKTGAALGRTRVSMGTIEEGIIRPTLRRTHSTIGFPATAEKYRRSKNKGKPQQAGHSQALTESVTASVASTAPAHTPRSQSLPNLSYVSLLPIEIFFPEPRRNLNKVHTRVKMLNTPKPVINIKANVELKKAYRVDNLRSVGDIMPRRNNYGVNEGKLNTEKEINRREFASYAVRTLAASAKTPEPESVPRTAL